MLCIICTAFESVNQKRCRRPACNAAGLKSGPFWERIIVKERKPKRPAGRAPPSYGWHAVCKIESMSLRIARLLILSALLRLPLCVVTLPADGATVVLRSELEDLQRLRLRLLIDFSACDSAACRLMIIENRNASDAVLSPNDFLLGFSSSVLIAGPVCLRGVLAELYNPLAHEAESAVFTQEAALSLDVDMEIGSRRGLQLMIVPGTWSLFALSRSVKPQDGEPRLHEPLQIGTAALIQVAPWLGCELLGILSAAPGSERQHEAWYPQQPMFPAGTIVHAAGTLRLDLPTIRILAAAAASGSLLVAPGGLMNFRLVWAGSRSELSALLGYCSPDFLTPEGSWCDLVWLADGHVELELDPLCLSAWYRRRIPRQPALPAAFRPCVDQLGAGADLDIRIRPDWRVRFDAQARGEVSRETDGPACKEIGVEAAASLGRSMWTLALELAGKRNSELGWAAEADLSFVHRPFWGRVEIEAGCRGGAHPGYHAAAAVEVEAANGRLYVRMNRENAVPPGWSAENIGEQLRLFTLRLGWEVKTKLPAAPASTPSAARPDRESFRSANARCAPDIDSGN